MTNDAHYMQIALRLARRGLGRSWPNPAVGCVIVQTGSDPARVIGRGWTQPGGRPHAEAVALAQARERYGEDGLSGATAYVSLEPCSHHGRTPPCADALIDARINRVVVGCTDPDARVSGDGIARLRSAGLDVTTNLLQGEAEQMNAGFIKRETAGRPLVTLKIATTADGRIATRNGASQWITGPAARERVHLMRAQHDAIMVGINTVIHDDPQLTCRLDGLEDRSPVRVVLDSSLRISAEARLVRTAGAVPTWVVTRDGGDSAVVARLQDAGVEVLHVAAGAAGHVDAGLALAELAARGITRVLVEGGAILNAALVRAGLVDRIAWFRAPSLLGGDGKPAFGDLGIEKIEDMLTFAPLAREIIGDDTLDIYRLLP
ncbi:MAG: bifunctional diaminohydroxyphosphoribosylaminopyrimidine deaminase/5-amino-6-(5-phosphoribosylamino)uracil reductase RibD [Alphaproteobacteria bacterium]|nr:bifunctional diaminohydroxyphosphoribosylaminopyrimidine deaminase/5-amino-6-(5-phosphoribosylamino)uracil reductase RibD [Alphaproteobacteria bacterium]